MKFNILPLTFAALGVVLAGCGGGAEEAPAAKAPSRMAKGGSSDFIVPDQPGQAVPVTVQATNSATFVPPPADPAAQSATMLNAQVMLDRAGFSPGVIDGRYGENVRQALAAFQEARGLPSNGTLDQATWQALQAVGGPPPLARYVLTQADIAGPYISGVPDKLQEQANLEALSYTSAPEMLAERFHMDEDLLRALNPGQAFLGAGAEIMVANPARPALTGLVARIEVDAKERAVRAYDAAGTLLAFYPATIGSAEQPSPSGSMTVEGVARNPTFTYDPAKLDYNREIKRRLTVAAGPNNPVGLVWIDLSKPTYGIHGAPEPDVIGKSQSNGCVRLTNWDVQALAAAVKPGVKVTFV